MPMPELRIYADFNSGGSPGAGPCWCLRFGIDRKPLDDLAAELGLVDGLEVVLYYEDASEEFEVRAHLISPKNSGDPWQALPDWQTERRIRG